MAATINATAGWVPKQGHDADEYEDAFALLPEGSRFAVADGASETSFARQWAELLVGGYVADPPEPQALHDWLGPLRERWQLAQRGRATAWYAEQKARSGAFASLLGVSFESGHWRAFAVGDSCLFVVRAGKLLRAFPLERAEQFHNRPVLLSSRPGANGVSPEHLWRAEGELAAKDRVLLMTDALAHWFLTEAELGRKPWAALARAATPQQFEELVASLRAGGALKNDDVTLVTVEVAA